MMPFAVILFCFCLTSSVQMLQTNEKTIFKNKRTTKLGVFPVKSFEENTDLTKYLRFDPPHLEFEALSVGTAQSHTVTIINQHNRSVYLSSVSGRVPSFYSSFFERKIVSPEGNTTFNVVFLPRERGTVASDLVVHTSFGSLLLSVRGVGHECPYRLKPIVGVKAPLNATLTPEIHMFNPHMRTLQIVEVYSSGGQFQLELPSGGQEGPQALWEIPPYSTKPVIRIRFHGKTAGNHTAYIRIKILEQPNDSVGPIENVLVIPVEFEILPNSGLYTENPVIDFGRIATEETSPIKVKLNLINSDERRLHDLISCDVPNMKGISFNMNDTSITLDPQQLNETMQLKNILVLRSAPKLNSSQIQEFSILICSDIFKGTLSYNRNTTYFIKAEKNAFKERRVLVVRNDFEMPLMLIKTNLDSNDTNVLDIQLNSNELNVVLQPGESKEILKLQTKKSNENFRTLLHIYTNVTDFDIPIIVCSGHLHVHTENTNRINVNSNHNTELNLGAVPLAEMSQLGFIVLQNRNPVPIKFDTWNFHSQREVYFHTSLLGYARDKDLTGHPLNVENTKLQLHSQLEEGDMAIFQIALQSYITETVPLEATLRLLTTYENITITVRFRTSVGILEVDEEKLYFKNCFPGKLCSSDLIISSTFQHPIHISSINFTEIGINFEDFNPKGSIIAPETTTRVGRIYFRPAKMCKERCYIPQNDESSDIAFPEPQNTKGGLNNNLHFDEVELRRRIDLFRQFKWKMQTLSLTINTVQMRQFELQIILDIEWPKLAIGTHTIPTVEIGEIQKTSIVIKNPANKPILVDYYLADPKFAKSTNLTLPLEVIDKSSTCYLTDQSVFSLAEQPLQKPILIPANGNISVEVQFTAQIVDTFCTLLHIRNNLTLYQEVWIIGKSVQTQFRFGNRKPGSKTPLLFEVHEKHLTACNKPPQKTNAYTPISIRRSFTARNLGEIPILIDAFFIDDQPCIGYGFKVINCKGFELPANASKRIEISFTPDFTLSRISRLLILKTNFSYDVSYTLLGQVPMQSLDLCKKMIYRPRWERQFRYTAIMLLLTSLAIVCFAVHVDIYRIFEIQGAVALSRDKRPVHPTFNLRNIGIKSLSLPEEPVTKNVIDTLQVNNKPKVNVAKTNSSAKKRVVDKNITQCTSELENMLLDDIDWLLDLPMDESYNENPTSYCEHNFMLLDTDKSVEKAFDIKCNSNTSSPEESIKSVTPVLKTAHKVKNVINSNQAITNNINKKQQRGYKKSKNHTPSPILREENTNTIAHKNKSKSIEKSDDICNNSRSTTVAKLNDLTDNSSSFENKSVSVTPKETVRKYGKTPGRERRRGTQHETNHSTHSTHSNSSSTASSSSISKQTLRKKKSKVVNSLNFNNSPTSDISNIDETQFNCITSPWDTGNQVSFSEVLQAKNEQQNDANHSPDNSSSDSVLKISDNNKKTNSQHSLFDIDLNWNQNNNVLAENNILLENNVATENVLTQTNSTDIITKEEFKIEDRRDSTELGPIGTKKSPSSTPAWESVASLSAPATNILLPKPQICSNSSFFSDTTNSRLFDLQNPQSELQLQWKAKDYGNETTNSWSINSPTWSSLVFGQQTHNGTVNGNNVLDPWQNTAVVRPPPGMESNYQNSNQAQQQQSTTDADMQAFDPFSSLSSIWTDNWNKTNNNGNNNN